MLYSYQALYWDNTADKIPLLSFRLWVWWLMVMKVINAGANQLVNTCTKSQLNLHRKTAKGRGLQNVCCLPLGFMCSSSILKLISPLKFMKEIMKIKQYLHKYHK